MAKTVHEELQDQLKYSGLILWHERGLTGKGVVIWNMENGKADHGKMTTIRIKHSAPDAEVINAGLSMSYDNSGVKHSYAVLEDGTRIETEEFIKSRGVKLLSRSVGGGIRTGGPESQFWNDLKKRYNLILFNSAGNEGSEGPGGSLPPDVAIYVAACGLIKGVPRRDRYSSIGEEIDFIDFRGFYSGTSFAAPYLCGKAALLVQKYGHHITQDVVYQYFKDHAEDIEEEGHDHKSGWGLPIMGEPATKVIMQIGNHKITVDGKPIILDQAPVYNERGDRTLVPLRAISEAFGAEVDWDPKTEKITIVR